MRDPVPVEDLRPLPQVLGEVPRIAAFANTVFEAAAPRARARAARYVIRRRRREMESVSFVSASSAEHGVPTKRAHVFKQLQAPKTIHMR